MDFTEEFEIAFLKHELDSIERQLKEIKAKKGIK